MPHRTSLIDLWDRLRSSYWFVPALMFVLAALVAAGMLSIDYGLAASPQKFHPWFPRFGADAARATLSTLASGLLTVTGVVFSLTIVALQLTSSQFGPRLLRSFMTNVGNQLVLGTFTSSFIYCIIVIASIRGDGVFVPQLSTAAGIALGVADIAVLIYFIHHVATSIRIETVMEMLIADLRDVIDVLFPQEIGAAPADPDDAVRQVAELPREAWPVPAAGAGYIRHIDREVLMHAATADDIVVRIEGRPGDFVVEGSALLHVVGRKAPDDVVGRLRDAVILGPDRTPRQDVNFAIRQLVEVALRALSPGINDPFTAIACTNRLGEALCRAVRRAPVSPYRVDADGRVRVVAPPISMLALLRMAFDPIARAGGNNGDVALVVLQTVLMVASCARSAADRRLIVDFAQDLKQQLDGQLQLERDRATIGERFTTALTMLANAEADQPEDGTTPGAARQPLRFDTEAV